MNETTSKIMFAILRSAICDEPLSEEQKLMLDEEMLTEMKSISKKHDIINILAYGLNRNGLLKNDDIEKEILKSVYRYTRLNYELTNLCTAFEKARIPFIPLKGSVIRKYYPEPWLRTSCDIDILIHDSDIETAKTYLLENLNYKLDGSHEYEISFYTAGGCHIELHFNLIEGDQSNPTAIVLKDIWNVAIKHENYNYWYEMPAEMFYFYQVVHMAKHFKIGGCGIRPFIDIFILNNMDYDREKCMKLFSDCELLNFSNAVELLSNVWFNHLEHTEITRKMEEYILRGGVYGTHENHILIQQKELGGKFKYALYKIFVPYDELKKLYPILGKHRFLVPIMEVRRWFRHIFFWRLKRATRELKYNNDVTKDEAYNVKIMLEEIGL